MFEPGANLVIELDTTEAPFRIHGEFRDWYESLEESFLVVKGTVANYSGKLIYIPVHRINLISCAV